ncbi:hypothetical protein N599_07800 [Saccharopolyspora erythraea D]|nr:hypothetical protein N599_07800 [Saccharopolyspora erythraea D]
MLPEGFDDLRACRVGLRRVTINVVIGPLGRLGDSSLTTEE